MKSILANVLTQMEPHLSCVEVSENHIQNILDKGLDVDL